MKIRCFDKNDFNALVQFNEKVFPLRDKIDEFIKYNFIENPFDSKAWNKLLIAVNEREEIEGQFLLLPSIFFFKGIKYPAFFGMDYIVDNINKNSIIGSILAKKAFKSENYITVGLSDISLKIHRALKQKIIGDIIKYIRFTSIFSIFRFVFASQPKDVSSFSFPEIIKISPGKFTRVFNAVEITAKDDFWNFDTMEFIRNEEFINWRFFHYPDKYFVYKYVSYSNIKTLKPTYFVVRPVIWKNVNCLLLVDYRYKFETDFHFDEILKASIQIMKKNNFAALIAGCSIENNKRKFYRKLFFPYGAKMHIVSKFDLAAYETNTENIMLTFADGDGDYYFGNKKW